ncbi:MAG: WecB/TagA/CpsF family glycosyltransferase [Proteobacteria bacterium]|nr:WecB/TagA/CpsF family glycosyltransferase [Pseudomonadota bacterium]
MSLKSSNPAVQNLEPVNIFGVRVDRLRAEEVLAEVENYLGGDRARRIYFVYANCLNVAYSDQEFREILKRADLVLNDGLGLEIAGRVLGKPFPENLCGTDFLPLVLERAGRLGKSVYLLGGKPGNVEACGERLAREIPGIKLVGIQSGYFTDEALVTDSIRAARPDLLLVGMGVPIQEKLIDRWIPALPVRLAIGVGAFLDFYSGAVPRAPLWVRRRRMEWLFRLVREPRRLWRRYLVGNMTFLLRLLRFRLAGDKG